MTPTIPAGSALVADMNAFRSKNPARWDVVIFQPPTMPGNVFVMRIVALPRETVSFLTGGIAVNGKVIVSPPSVKNVAYVSLDHPRFAGDRNLNVKGADAGKNERLVYRVRRSATTSVSA